MRRINVGWLTRFITRCWAHCSEQSWTTEAGRSDGGGASELWCHSLAHLEDLDGEGRVSGYGSRKSHGAVAVHVLASNPLHFLRYCAEDRADSALLWRLRGTQGGGGQLATARPCYQHQNGCKRRTLAISKDENPHSATTMQDNDSKHERLRVPTQTVTDFNIFGSFLILDKFFFPLWLPICSESHLLFGREP